MCWNEAVSMNTFLFSSFVLLLIVYNNSFTKYKIKELDNKWIYIFMVSVILMQLIEFFIWRNINNKYYNNLFSIFAVVLLIVQPIASIMIIQTSFIRNILLFIYLLLAIPFSIYQFAIKQIHTTVSKNGHLDWRFFDVSSLFLLIWLFFLLFSLIYEKLWTLTIFGIVTFIIFFINYKNNTSGPSIWCWIINSLMIYYIIYLLLFLPFLEKMQIC
jgi:hypothetical protein